MRSLETAVRVLSLVPLTLGALACAPAPVTTPTDPSETPEPLELEPGWRWLVAPRVAPDSWPSRWDYTGGPGRTSWTLERAGDRVRVTVRHSPDALARTVDGSSSILAPKLSLSFDHADAFELVRVERARSRDGIVTRSYVLRGPVETITTVGLAVLDAEGRKVRSEAAAPLAAEAGIATISLPVRGEPLDVPTFTTLDGDRVSHEQLRGKIVLLDFWATWCSACIDEFPHLIALYQELGAALGPDQIVFLGFNLDEHAGTARRVAQRHALPWAQIHIPHDDATRRAWEQIAGISSLPRVVVLDREGIVRALLLDELDEVLHELADPADA